jgi:hypothetical protein
LSGVVTLSIGDIERRARIAQRVAELRASDARVIRELDDLPNTDEGRARKELVLRNVAASNEIAREIEPVLGVAAGPDDLRRMRLPYPEAIPILLRQLERTDLPEGIWVTIVQALTPSFARKQSLPALVAQLRERHASLSDHAIFQLGCGIADTAGKKDAATLLAIVLDPRYGGARMLPMLKLARQRDPGVADIALAFLKLPHWQWTGLRALRLARVWDAASEVEPFLRSAEPAFREEARAYFKALGAAHA